MRLLYRPHEAPLGAGEEVAQQMAPRHSYRMLLNLIFNISPTLHLNEFCANNSFLAVHNTWGAF